MGVVSILAICGLIIPKTLIRLFQDESETVRIGSYALRSASIGVIFVPICITTNMAYQSVRKSEIASFLALLRSGLIFIPLVYILKHYINLKGIQIAMPISNTLAGILSIPFLLWFIIKTPKIDYNEDLSMNLDN